MIASARLAGTAFFCLIIGALAACSSLAPAADRPHLRQSPGAFVALHNGRFKADGFQFTYPQSWRVVKSSMAAESHLRITLVAPSGGTVTLLELPPADHFNGQILQLDNGIRLGILIEAADAPAPTFDSETAQIIASIRS